MVLGNPENGDVDLYLIDEFHNSFNDQIRKTIKLITCITFLQSIETYSAMPVLRKCICRPPCQARW